MKRSLSIEDIHTEKYDIFESLVAEIFLEPIDENLVNGLVIVVRETTNILRIFESFWAQNRPILQIRHFCSVLFCENHLSLAKS